MRNGCAFLCLLLGSIFAQNGPTNVARVERWREDLKAFGSLLRGADWKPSVKDVPPGQKDLAKLYPGLDEDLAALERDLPTLRDGEIHLRLARVMASAHVAHNTVHLYVPQRLPLTLEWLSEGPVVIAASAENKSAIGAKLVKMGTLTSTELLDAVGPYISAETDGWRRVKAGDFVLGRILLETLGVAQGGRVELTLEGANGLFILPAAFTPADTPQIDLREAMGVPLPLAQSRPDQPYYWGQFLEDSETFYIQYNRCADDPKQPFARFTKEVLAKIDETRARRVIVDLRNNTGGASGIINPLVDGLAARRKAIGAPFVLIGPRTFSSAVMNADNLRGRTKAILVGEPAGGLLGGYGEAPTRQLPNSKLSIQWTIKHFGRERVIQPDIPVITTLADQRAGRDAPLRAALSARR